MCVAGHSELEKRVSYSSMRPYIRCNILCDFLFRRITTLGRSQYGRTEEFRYGWIWTSKATYSTTTEHYAIRIYRMYYSFFNIINNYVKINEYLITIIDTIEISTVFYIVNKYNYLKLFKKCTNTQDFELGRDRNCSGGIGWNIDSLVSQYLNLQIDIAFDYYLLQFESIFQNLVRFLQEYWEEKLFPREIDY